MLSLRFHQPMFILLLLGSGGPPVVFFCCWKPDFSCSVTCRPASASAYGGQRVRGRQVKTCVPQRGIEGCGRSWPSALQGVCPQCAMIKILQWLCLVIFASCSPVTGSGASHDSDLGTLELVGKLSRWLLAVSLTTLPKLSSEAL